MSAILSLKDISVRFGGVNALSGVAMTVERGSVHGLIGPNGAGKTTLLNVICRLVTPHQGSVSFEGHDLLAASAERLASLGIARTFQNLALIDAASVLDNVLVGLHTRIGGGLRDELFQVLRGARRQREAEREARQILATFGLAEFAELPVRQLSYGQRKMVELARAWAVRPALLLLDEPTAGLNSAEIAWLQGRLGALRGAHGLTMLVITHHIEFLIGMADRITVLDLGRPIAEGSLERVRADPAVIAAYLGAQ